MREIKFRAKDLEGVWRHGSLRHDLGEWFIYENAKHKVNGETIGQFTGLKDKKGNEIYEGDIVRSIRAGDWNAVVEWHADVACFEADTNYDPKNFWELVQDKRIEVIGNIYENRELLK